MRGQNVKGLNLLFFQKVGIEFKVISLREEVSKC